MNNKKIFIVQPYLVGSGKSSLAMIVPSPVVKSLRIDPINSIFYLKVNGPNEMQLKILREDDPLNKDQKKMVKAS